jgi:hypothetical protein
MVCDECGEKRTTRRFTTTTRFDEPNTDYVEWISEDEQRIVKKDGSYKKSSFWQMATIQLAVNNGKWKEI